MPRKREESLEQWLLNIQATVERLVDLAGRISPPAFDIDECVSMRQMAGEARRALRSIVKVTDTAAFRESFDLVDNFWNAEETDRIGGPFTRAEMEGR